jgi:acyl-CoA thioester hydrolase
LGVLLSHTSTFRVRFYECDAYGHVNNTTYLRYMQEAAFDASAAAGYDTARYDAMGRYWLIRSSTIEYLRPLRYGDSLSVKTWIEDFRRVRSLRAYEFRHVITGELIATATTDWVFVESGSGTPATIPAELIAAFSPEGAPSMAPPRRRAMALPPPPPQVFTVQRHVSWQDIDPAQHVNNAIYLAYAEDAGVQVAAAHGWPMARMMDEGFGIIARRHQVEYRVAARLDDDLDIATWVSDVKRATALRHYAIRRASDRELIASVTTLWVWVNLQTGMPMRIPSHFMSAFSDNIVSATSGAASS